MVGCRMSNHFTIVCLWKVNGLEEMVGYQDIVSRLRIKLNMADEEET